jgi:hypothetical protein
MQVGMGFWPSKVLLTAVNEGLFTHLAQKPLSLSEIKSCLAGTAPIVMHQIFLTHSFH